MNLAPRRLRYEDVLQEVLEGLTRVAWGGLTLRRTENANWRNRRPDGAIAQLRGNRVERLGRATESSGALRNFCSNLAATHASLEFDSSVVNVSGHRARDCNTVDSMKQASRAHCSAMERIQWMV